MVLLHRRSVVWCNLPVEPCGDQGMKREEVDLKIALVLTITICSIVATPFIFIQVRQLP